MSEANDNSNKATSSTTTKISFQLSKTCKKNVLSSTKLSLIDDSTSREEQQFKLWEERAKQRQKGEASPLVIPLVLPSSHEQQQEQQQRIAAGTTTAEDTQAIAALEQDAFDFQALSSTNGDKDTTNFSAQGSLVVSKTSSSSDNKPPLLLSASRRYTMADSTSGGADGEAHPLTESEQFTRDVSTRPAELSPTDTAYRAIPVHEFGAAMLRGMGWQGEEDTSGAKKGKDTMTQQQQHQQRQPRHYRLGLGATPAPKITSLGKSKSNGSAATLKRYFATGKSDELQSSKQQDEEKIRQQEQQKLAMKELQQQQSTLCVGSIVHILQEEKETRRTVRRRAVVLQTSGVPGFNRVRVQYDGGQEEGIVQKGDIELIPLQELEQNLVFYGNGSKGRGESNAHAPPASSLSSMKRKRQKDDRDLRKNEENDVSERDRYRDDHGRKDGPRNSDGQQRRVLEESDDDDQQRSHHDTRYREQDEKEYDRKRSGSNERYDRHEKDRSRHHEKRHRERDRHPHDKDRERDEGHHAKQSSHGKDDRRDVTQQHWLIPNIRVRVITHKIDHGRHNKQKGIVLDTSRPGEGTIKMDSSGQILERIKEKYLETALPKEGGRVVILQGQNMYKRGRLLERDSKSGRGVVQLAEDMDVISLSLDDIAEWCGPWDEEEVG